VTTIEIDATLAQQARTSLTGAGRFPTVITGDGAAGGPGLTTPTSAWLRQM